MLFFLKGFPVKVNLKWSGMVKDGAILPESPVFISRDFSLNGHTDFAKSKDGGIQRQNYQTVFIVTIRTLCQRGNLFLSALFILTMC